MRIRRLAAVLAVGVTATLVPALAPARASAAGPLHGFEGQHPAWHHCGTSTPAAYQCATIAVPLDYDHPTGKTIHLAISRLKAGGSGDRHGALLFNPGGPGGPGLDMPLAMDEMMPANVRDQYDLVGFDPRGVGRSTPVTCGLTAAEQNTERPYRPETFGADVAWARTVASKCRAENGGLLRHITTRDTARDMDLIRAVLGEKKISYLGYSYGTYLGAVYAQMFPEHTDRFVLDSSVDPARIWRGMIQVWAEGAEPAFSRWAGWTAARDTAYGLGTTATAVRRTFWDLVARADREPIPYNGDKLDGADVRAVLRPLFFAPQSAAETVAALKAAADGKPSSRRSTTPDAGTLPQAPAAHAPGEEAQPEEAPADNASVVFWSVVCGDTSAWPRDPERYRRDAVRDRARYPLYGDFGSNITPCAFWDEPADPAPAVHNDVGLLTVQNQWDPQTPLASGLGMHRALKGSRMVYVKGGEGHGVYDKDPHACANRAVNAYLSTGRLPARDVTCEAPAGQGTDRRADTVPPPRRAPAAPAF